MEAGEVAAARMGYKGRLLLSWATGALLLAGVFYGAVAWLWAGFQESRAESLESQVVSALSNDLAEGNLFKLGVTLARLQRDGLLRSAEIRQIEEGGNSGVVFRTQGGREATDRVFADFRCGDRHKRTAGSTDGISLVTTLPSSIPGAECAALYVHSDAPPELKQFKRRIMASVGTLVVVVFGVVFGVFSWLVSRWQRRMWDLETAHKLAQAEKDAAVGRIAAQVAHDIRSPLAALDSELMDASALPERRRKVIRTAAGRIRDIANELIERYRVQGTPAVVSDAGPAAPELVLGLMEPVIGEKRTQFRSKTGVAIECRAEDSCCGLLAEVQPARFQRVLSNLVNNAVESLGERGAVAVRLASKDGRVLVSVEDDGKGIPPEVLARLGGKGETHGKAGGSGLGLFHAKQSVESWGGSLDIRSEAGKGTTVTVSLPQARPPEWFASRLELPPDAVVAILDDDPSVHQLWQSRFDLLRSGGSRVEAVHCAAPQDLRDWVRNNPGKARGAVYLVDFELRGHEETGLDMVEELGLGGRTVLVTSHYGDKAVQERCARVGARLLPKPMIGSVPVSAGRRLERDEPAKPGRPGPDVVLLDDDELVLMNWETRAETRGLKFLGFTDPKELLAAAKGLPKDTAVYLDSELDDGGRGEDVAKDLHAWGFTNLFLATGHDPETLPAMPWIKRVVGKRPPWE